MSTIQTQKKWQPEPTKKLVGDTPVREGAKFHEQEMQVRCVICSTPKVPGVFDFERNPLVLTCPKCGHKSWASTMMRPNSAFV